MNDVLATCQAENDALICNVIRMLGVSDRAAVLAANTESHYNELLQQLRAIASSMTAPAAAALLATAWSIQHGKICIRPTHTINTDSKTTSRRHKALSMIGTWLFDQITTHSASQR